MIIITAKQLRNALEFVNPGGETHEDEVTISHLSEREVDGEIMPAGLYAWLTEHQEEGCIPLDDDLRFGGDAA